MDTQPPKPAAAPCPECGVLPPGHKVLCRIGIARAKQCQDRLAREFRDWKRGRIKPRPR